MFTSDEITYIELQKTGSTHIITLLSQLFEGERIGSHNAATPKQFASSKYFVSSIRNPWKWYVSLWTYGAQGVGQMYTRLTQRGIREPARVFYWSHSISKAARSALNEITKDVDFWRAAYNRNDEVSSFRSWMRLIHDPRHAASLGEGYADTQLQNQIGYMTYRYLNLCCRNVDQLGKRRLVSDYDSLVRFDEDNCYIDYFIRQEALEDTFCEAVERVRPLTDDEKQLIYGAKKRNKSTRALPVTAYYDDELVDLVSRRDKLIIEKFGYEPPN